jgi:putative transposase
MLALISTLLSWLARRFRGRAELELELIALRHQVAVLNRQRRGPLRLYSVDRMLWVWLYRVCPRCLRTMVPVKPANVVQWHRQSFRLYWR